MDKDLFGGYFSTTTVRLGEGQYREFCEVRTGPNFASFFHIPVLAGEMFKYPGQRVADRIIDGIYGGKVITDGFEDIDGKKNKYLWGGGSYSSDLCRKSYVGTFMDVE